MHQWGERKKKNTVVVAVIFIQLSTLKLLSESETRWLKAHIIMDTTLLFLM